MKQINTCFQNIRVVTPLSDGTVVSMPESYVSVKDGVIAYAGPSAEAARAVFADQSYETYNGKSKMLAPAMANTHSHLAMTLMRNQADDLNLHSWLFDVIFPRETRLNEKNVYVGTQLGIAEMIRGGIGASADMYYFSESVAQASLDAGFRLNLCCDAKKPGPDGKIVIDPDDLDHHLAAYHGKDGLLQVSMLVHSVYLYEEGLYRELAQMAASSDCAVQVHIAETQKEIDDCQKKYNGRPAQVLQNFGFFKTPTLAAHCVFLDDSERNVLKNPNIVVAHNPSSNLKLGSGIAEVDKMLKAGIRVGLGTDGPASNNNLDLYKEMRLASFLAKGTSRDATVLPAGTIFNMATQQGMAGLGFKQSGRIEQGSAADLQVIDCDHPAMTPLGDPIAALVYSTDAARVESLMVNGSWLMNKNELVTLDEEKILHEAVSLARDLNNILDL